VVLVIRERDAVVEVVAGAPFDVRLASAPTTGYGWEIAHLPPGVELLGSDFDISPDAAVGDGGVQVFRLVANHSGRFELRFVLKRRWEQEPIDIRVVEVVAASAAQ
jgi:predicted secreted protein